MAHVASAEQRRQHANYAAGVLSAAASRRTSPTDRPIGVSCAWASDMMRVQAALWTRAGAQADPEGTFFTYADRVLRAAASATPSASGLLERAREAYTGAAMMLNVPLVLPRTEGLSDLTDVDLTGLPALVTGGRDPSEFVPATVMQAANRNLNPVVRTRMVLHAYLVDVAHRTGDTLMVSAAARLAALDDLTGNLSDPHAILTAAVRLLGPIEEVRLRPYLRQAGLG